ncbi:MAG TPA: hypothetical protein VF695_06750 [Sphingomonas sp.]
MMMMVVGTLIFAGAFAVSLAVIALAVGPQWRRIGRLAMGHVEAPFAPLATLAHAERRIAVRRWASAPAPTAPFLSRRRLAA